MKWDAKLFDQTADSRHESGMRLVKLAAIGKSDRVLDIGAGTGAFTTELASRAANVVAIEPSKEMFSAASARSSGFDNILLMNIKAEEMEFNAKFDLAFSNNALQWINDHRRVLPRIHAALKSGGRLALQLPARNFTPEFFAHIQGAVDTLGLGGYFDGWQSPWYFPAKDEYEALLSDAGFCDMDVSYAGYTLRFNSVNGVLDWLCSAGILPYLDALPHGEHERFKYAVAMNYEKNRIAGNIVFGMRRLIALARKP